MFESGDERVDAGAEQGVLADPGVVGAAMRGRVAAQALERGGGDSASWPSGTMRPLAPSRTSSRLAGRSDSSGRQPCAIASSTETDTESLRGTLRYQGARA